METIVNKANNIDFYRDLFTHHIQNGHSVATDDILNKPREEAFEKFLQKGIPNFRVEKYKYTDLSRLLGKPFIPLLRPQQIDFNIDDIFKCDVPDLDTHVVILLNGFYYHKLNFEQGLPENIVVESLKEAAASHPELVEKYYRKYADEDEESLVALNTAFAQDGLFLYVPKNTRIDKPIQIINLAMSENDLMIQHRNLFVFEENTEGKILICDHSLSPNGFLTNQVAEVHAAENAHVDITKIQNAHNETIQLTHTYIHQLNNSNVSHNAVTLHGGLVRNNVSVNLNGEGANNDSLGLYITDTGQHVDNYVFMHHSVPHATSNQLFKGILDDFSRGVFNGKIYVNKDAQKTLAYQANNNLLLTDDAKMNAKPQLEIYADDVKCSHGATVGQLDQDALFYLKSRGIHSKEARLMLMYAFVYDVIKEIKMVPLRNRIEELVNKRLRGELSRCNNCEINCGKL